MVPANPAHGSWPKTACPPFKEQVCKIADGLMAQNHLPTIYGAIA